MDEAKAKINNILAVASEKIENPVMVLASDRRILYINDIMKDTFGLLEGHKAGILFMSGEEPDYDEVVGIYRRANSAIEIKIADVDYRLIETKVKYDGQDYLVVMLEDISEKKNLENQINERLQRHLTDVNMAGLIQKSLLPDDGEYWGSVRFDSVFMPAEDLSGDAYDIIRLNENETLFYIADVSGHGIQASLLTIYINERVRANAELAREGLDLLLAEVLRGFIILGLDSRIYMSILCCRYDRRLGELSIANAGHNCYPLILRKNGRTEEIPVRGMPISVISEADSYTEEIINISAGDKVILYTDGIIEEYSKKKKAVFGSEGVRKTAEAGARLPGGELVHRIMGEAAKYMMVTAKDDRTILIAEML